MGEFLKSIDKYGEHISLRVDNYDTFRTKIGGIGTILTIIIVISFVSGSLPDFVYRKNVKASTETKLRNLTLYDIVDTKDLEFVMYFSYRSKDGLSLQGYSPSSPSSAPLSLKTGSNQITLVKSSLSPNVPSFIEQVGEVKKLTNFSYNDFSKKISSYFNNPALSLKDSLFYTSYNPSNLSLGGDMSNNSSISTVYGAFYMDLCSFTSQCMNATYLAGLMQANSQGYQMWLAHKEAYSNFTNEKGFSSSSLIHFTSLNLLKDYSINIKLKKNQITTDNNWLFNLDNNQTTKSYYSIETSIINRVRSSELPNIIEFDFSIEIDQYEIEIKRSYDKIEVFLATVFSIARVVDAAMRMLIMFINFGTFDDFIVNKIYFYYEPQSNEHKILQEIGSNQVGCNLKDERDLGREFWRIGLKTQNTSNIDIDKSRNQPKLKVKKSLTLDKPVELNYLYEPNSKEKYHVFQSTNNLKDDGNEEQYEKLREKEKSEETGSIKKEISQTETTATVAVEITEHEKYKISNNFHGKKIPSVNNWRIFCYSIFCYKRLMKCKQMTFLNNSKNYLKYDLDIITYLKKIIEVEKFKSILLNEDQVKLFDFAKTRKVHCNLCELKNIESKYIDNHIKLDDYIKVYETIKRRSTQSVLDEKIKSLLA